jgi:hypothetical protein
LLGTASFVTSNALQQVERGQHVLHLNGYAPTLDLKKLKTRKKCRLSIVDALLPFHGHSALLFFEFQISAALGNLKALTLDVHSTLLDLNPLPLDLRSNTIASAALMSAAASLSLVSASLSRTMVWRIADRSATAPCATK